MRRLNIFCEALRGTCGELVHAVGDAGAFDYSKSTGTTAFRAQLCDEAEYMCHPVAARGTSVARTRIRGRADSSRHVAVL